MYAFSQSWSEYNALLKDNYYKGQYYEAITYGEKALIQAEKEFGTKDANYTTTLNNLAMLYAATGQYAIAESYYLKAIDIQKKILGKNSIDYAISLNNLAVLYNRMGETQKAEPLYLEALEIVKGLYGEKNEDYASMTGNIAVFYNKQGRYAEAEKYYLIAAEINKSLFGEKNEAYATNLNNMAIMYAKMGVRDKAKIYFEQSLKIRKEVLGSNHPEYANSLNNFAAFLETIGLYREAEPYYLESLALYKKTLGEKHPDYAFCMNNIGGLYLKMGLYDKAEIYLNQAFEIRRSIFGNEHPDYLSSLNDLALLYSEKGQYDKAEDIYRQLLKTQKEVLGESHPDYITSLGNSGHFHLEAGHFDKAEVSFTEGLDIVKESMGTNNPYYASLLNYLALLFEKTSRYEKALTLCQESLKIRTDLLGEKHPDVAVSLNNLAVICERLGDFNKAEECYIKAVEIRRELLGDMHPEYAASLNNLALYYLNAGQYEKAEIGLQKSLDIIKVVLGDMHPDVARKLNNLGLLYAERGNYKEAEDLYLEALEIAENNFGKKHPEYAVDLNNLAGLYFDKKEYEKAQKLYLQAMKIKEELSGTNSLEYATALNNIAFLYLISGNYKKAEEGFIKALELQRKLLGENSMEYSLCLNNLIRLYYGSNDIKKAKSLIIAADSLLLAKLRSSFSFMSEYEQQKYLATFNFYFDTYTSFFASNVTSDPSLAVIMYNNQLVLKNALLNSSRQMARAVMESKDTSLINTFNQWLEVKQKLAFQQQQTLEKQVNVPHLEEVSNNMEKELAKRSTAFRDINASLMYNCDSISAHLKDGEAAVEFISFRKDNGKDFTDTVLYYALILRKDDLNPKVVFLAEETHLINAMQNGKNDNESVWVNATYNAKRGAGVTGNITRPDLNYSGDILYDLVWQPLDTFLSGINDVWYSPSGLLHKISLAALPDDSGIRLIDKYNLNYVSSTGLLLHTDKQTNYLQNVTSADFYGGVNYERTEAQAQQIENNAVTALSDQYKIGLAEIPGAVSRSNSFGYLEGTNEEVEKLSGLLKERKVEVRVISGDQATEALFKQSCNENAPEILHIATHGFFFPEPDKNHDQAWKEQLSENGFYKAGDPLLRSGLALAGANFKWTGNQVPDNEEDGILTAREVSALNLQNTRLVVLSACETGLGDIKGSEGVYGLQRAFKLAGAKYIIMSLWQVPDRQTVELMELFYTHYLKQMPVRQAFHEAQKEMKNRYPDQPFYWAAFVLVE